MRYGSLLNSIQDGSIIVPIKVGVGATLLQWTDRYAGTIVEVQVANMGPHAGEVTKVVWQRDTARPNPRADGTNPGNSEFHDYSYSPNPKADRETFTLRMDGAFRQVGQPTSTAPSLVIGVRDEYYDPSF